MKARRARTARPRPPLLRITIDADRLSRAGAWGAGGMALAVAVWLCGPPLRDAVRTHPYFAVSEVVVRHRGRLDDADIRTLAGVVPGTSIWDVEAEPVETRLLTQGWIRSATVRRELPGRVILQVREHRPIAILMVADETPGLYYLAANGRIFAPVGRGDDRDLPYVTGLTRSDLGGSDAFGPRAVRRTLALVRLTERHPELGAVSEVHVDRTLGLTLMPVRPALPIEIGWGDYDDKLARLREVLPLWTGREGELASVSCVFDDEVIVRMRAAGRASGGAKRERGAARAAAGA